MMRPNTPLRISLVICTYNRAGILPQCLDAVCDQTLPPSEYEVLVVDNNSTDGTRQAVERYSNRVGGPSVRYVHEPVCGLSHARNAGARASFGPIVCYIDDDAIADTDLLRQLLKGFEAGDNAARVGGRIDLCLPESLPWWHSALLDGYYSKFDPGFSDLTKLTNVSQYPFGANVSFLKSALDSVNYFDAGMGRMGQDYSGGEEIDAACRLAKHGYGIYYSPFAIVRHCIPASRMRWAHVEKSARAAGRNWAHYEETLKAGGLWPDFLALLATIKQMMLAGGTCSLRRFMFAYSNHILIRSKVGCKVSYRAKHWRE